MLLSMNDITEWLGCNFERRNYVFAEKILNAKHLTRCGLNATEQNANDITFWAQCISTSKPKEKPHDINGVIKKNGKIISVKCSCVAGLGEKCKHSVAALLFIYKSDNLSILSCTDKKCSWKTQEYNNAIENLKPVPMTAHVCPTKPLKKRKSLSDQANIDDNLNSITRKKNKDNNIKLNELTDQQFEDLNMELLIDLPNSSLAKDKFGRHDPVQHVEKSIDLTQNQKDLIMRIFSTQTSELMENIKNINLSVEPDPCCIKILEELSKELPELCCQTKLSYSSWREARRCRITGSICQKILGHSKSHNPQWSQKFVEFFYPKSFSSKYTKHGIETEPEARAEFVKQNQMKVIEIGLVVSQQMPAFAYSPDGIVDNPKTGKLELLEIKCPYKGKSKNISVAVESQVGSGKIFCKVDNGQYIWRKSHSYYAQMQLGMAVLNIELTNFVIYCSRDKSMVIFKAPIDEPYLRNILPILKNTYYTYLLPEICMKRKNNIIENNIVN